MNYAINSAGEENNRTCLVQTVFGTLDLLVLVMAIFVAAKSFLL